MCPLHYLIIYESEQTETHRCEMVILLQPDNSQLEMLVVPAAEHILILVSRLRPHLTTSKLLKSCSSRFNRQMERWDRRSIDRRPNRDGVFDEWGSLCDHVCERQCGGLRAWASLLARYLCSICSFFDYNGKFSSLTSLWSLQPSIADVLKLAWWTSTVAWWDCALCGSSDTMSMWAALRTILTVCRPLLVKCRRAFFKAESCCSYFLLGVSVTVTCIDTVYLLLLIDSCIVCCIVFHTTT